MKGLRNDIEVFRCRGLIDQTPVYQDYLAKVNAIRHEFPDLLLEGRYSATDGFTCTCQDIVARSYITPERLAVVAVYTGEGRRKATIDAPGYKLAVSRCIGDAKTIGNRVNLGQNGLAVLIFEAL